jgi:carbon monoxide dehydrogenase subunit G
MHVTGRAVIRQPPEAVFAFLARPENHPRFVPGLTDFGLISDEMGPDARLSGVRRDFGVRQRLSYRVSAFEPPRTLALTGQVGPLLGVATYELAPLGSDQTDLRFEIEGSVRGPFGFADRLLGPMLRRAAEETPANLKRVVEASTEAD